MNNEAVETVLNEILNEQKETGKLNKQLVQKIEYLSGKIEHLEKETNGPENGLKNNNIEVLHETIKAGISEIKETIIAQQQNVLPEKRIMIFPEFRSPECFRLLFNCILYLTIATYGFLILKVVVDHWFK